MSSIRKRTGLAGLVIALGIVAVYLLWLQTQSAGGLGGLGGGSAAPADSLTPHPGLSPQDVIAIQLTALKHNDTPTPDAGIATTFRFASPANQAATGPVENFAQVVRSPEYLPLINHRSVRFGPVVIDKVRAMQSVQMEGADGNMYIYTFLLTLQNRAPYAGCWMTDGVRLEAASLPEPPSHNAPDSRPDSPADGDDGDPEMPTTVPADPDNQIAI